MSRRKAKAAPRKRARSSGKRPRFTREEMIQMVRVQTIAIMAASLRGSLGPTGSHVDATIAKAQEIYDRAVDVIASLTLAPTDVAEVAEDAAIASEMSRMLDHSAHDRDPDVEAEA